MKANKFVVLALLFTLSAPLFVEGGKLYGTYDPYRDSFHNSTLNGWKEFWFSADKTAHWHITGGDTGSVLGEFFVSAKDSVISQYPTFFLDTDNWYAPDDIGDLRLVRLEGDSTRTIAKNPSIVPINVGLIAIIFDEDERGVAFRSSLTSYLITGTLGASYLPGDEIRMSSQKFEWGDVFFKNSGRKITRGNWPLQTSGSVLVYDVIEPITNPPIPPMPPIPPTPPVLPPGLPPIPTSGFHFHSMTLEKHGVDATVTFTVVGQGQRVHIERSADLENWIREGDSFVASPGAHEVSRSGYFANHAFFRLAVDE